MTRTIDVMIAGAQKAGTSTLAAALEVHPQLASHEALEFTWFVEPTPTESFEAAYDRVVGAPPRDRVVLAKSAGVMFVPEARQELARRFPSCRVVVILRHPVDRAWSAYWYLRRTGREPATTFEAAIDRGDDPDLDGWAHQRAYLERSDYPPQLEALDDLFGDRVHVVLFDDLVHDQAAVVADAVAAIGLDPSAMPDEVGPIEANTAAQARSARVARMLRSPGTLLRTAGRLAPPSVRERVKGSLIAANERAADIPPMDPATRQRLLAHFAPSVQAVEQRLGRPLPEWHS